MSRLTQPPPAPQAAPTATDHPRPRVRCRTLAPGCRVSEFGPPVGPREVHLFVEPSEEGTFEEQQAQVLRTYHEALATLGLTRHSAVFRRLFVSDAANQQEALMASPLGLGVPDGEEAAVSCIEQPPLCFRKLALMAYHVSDVRPDHKRLEPVPGGGPHARTLTLERPERRWLWTTQMTGGTPEGEAPDSRRQTEELFGAYGDLLARDGMDLLQNAVRTWVFVQGVDGNYQGMVDARRELFLEQGLNPRSHYIVSTGIEGRTADPRSLVDLDALAVQGLHPDQMVYLDCLDHLNRTHDYGVTFERAVRLDHRDRSHLFLSGTASIDAAGDILHQGDVLAQVERTLENIRALLEVGGAGLDDMAAMIVYLRDAADTGRVKAFLERRFPDTLAFTTVRAPVCRPGWLVEIEGLAILAHDDPRWPRF